MTPEQRRLPSALLMGRLTQTASADDDGAARRDSEAMFTLWATRHQRFARGTQVCNSYGRRANEHLLMEYGFALEDNHWQSVPLPLYLIPPFGDVPVPVARDVQHRGVTDEHIMLMRTMLRTHPLRLRYNRFAEDLLPLFRVLASSADSIGAMIATGSTCVASKLAQALCHSARCASVVVTAFNL